LIKRSEQKIRLGLWPQVFLNFLGGDHGPGNQRVADLLAVMLAVPLAGIRRIGVQAF